MDHASFFSEATLIAHLHDDVMHALHACSQENNKMVAYSGGGFTCCVPGCFTNSKRDTHLSFYVFPKEKNLRRRWLHSISRKNFKPTTGHRVCSLHFKGGKKPTWTLGPFIQGKIRRELYHLYEHVLSKTRTPRINGSRLIFCSWLVFMRMLPVATAI